jgi:hypothetical protein
MLERKKEIHTVLGKAYCIKEKGCMRGAGDPPKNCDYFLEQTLYSMLLEEKGKQDAK